MNKSTLQYFDKAQIYIDIIIDVKIILMFVFIDKPDVDINTNKPGKYYKYGNDYTLTCSTDSVPPVSYNDIWFEFAPCAINACPKGSSDLWRSPLEYNISVVFESMEEKQDQLQLLATRTGAFRCRAKNEVGNSSSAIEIFKISGR